MSYEVQYVPSKIEGRVGVRTPFNQCFVDELKASLPGAKFTGHPTAVWEYDEEYQDIVTALVQKYFIDVERVRITWQFDRDGVPCIDGVRLMYLGRDWFKWHGDMSLRVIEQDGLHESGSRRHPTISGTAVVECVVRHGAVIEPEPISVEPSPEPAEKPNPLAAVPVSRLLAELERRGAELTDVLTALGWQKTETT